jgi:hypothetical protein
MEQPHPPRRPPVNSSDAAPSSGTPAPHRIRRSYRFSFAARRSLRLPLTSMSNHGTRSRVLTGTVCPWHGGPDRATVEYASH